MTEKSELDLIKDCQNYIGKDIQELSTENVYYIYDLGIKNCFIEPIKQYQDKAVAFISEDLEEYMSLREISVGMEQNKFKFT